MMIEMMLTKAEKVLLRAVGGNTDALLAVINRLVRGLTVEELMEILKELEIND